MTRKRERYDGQRWRRFRARILRERPICEDPGGCNQPSLDVHHLDGLGLRGPRAYDDTNVEALCHSHHSKRTAQEQPAGWHRAQQGRKRPTGQHPGLI